MELNIISNSNVSGILQDNIQILFPESNSLTSFFFLKLHNTLTSRSWVFMIRSPSLFERVGSIINRDRENIIHVIDRDIDRKSWRGKKHDNNETRFHRLW